MMATEKQAHTPGPWTAEPWSYEDGKRVVVTIRNDQDAVAQITPVWRTDDTGPAVDEANARLIAAAPGLLAACEAALRMTEACGGWADPGHGAGIPFANADVVLDNLRNAIRAAGGTA